MRDTLQQFSQVMTTWARNAGAPRSTKSNLRNPDTFDGSDPDKLPSFLAQCYLHFAERTQDFPTDDDKIYFIISYLRGIAQQWFTPNLYNTKVPAWDNNFVRFIEELSINFGPHDPVGDAEDRIRLCRMKNGDRIATYVLAFDTLASLTDWGDAALRHQFYEGLPRRIKDEMVRHTHNNTLLGVKMVARNIDAWYHRREAEKQRERELEQAAAGRSGNRSGPPDNTGDRTGKVSGKQKEKQKGGNNTKPPGNSTAPPPYSNPGNRPGAGGKGGQANKQAGPSKPYADKLGADGKIKEAERERRRKNNLCMYCGGQGHSAEDCKKRPEKASGRSAQAGTPPQGDASTPESSKN